MNLLDSEKREIVKLIYIDPPFVDFSMDIEIGDETFTKRPNVLTMNIIEISV